jgi:predicted ATPase
MDSEDVINAIAGLVDKSLVYLEPTGDPVRWRMLETTRAYALQALKQAGEYDATARRQAEYYAEYLSTAGDEFLRPTSEHVGAFMLDIDNVRGALDWAFSSPRDVVLGVQLTGAAIPLWLGMSLLTECRDRIGRALNSLPPDSPLDPHVRLRLYAALGVSLLGTLAMPQQTGSALDEMLAIAEELDNVDYLLQALWTLWSYYLNNGMNRDAKLVARKLMEVARRGGAGQDFSVGERLLGTAMHYRGQQSEAQRHLEDVLSHYVAPADHLRRFHFDQAVLARSMLARVQWMRGLTEQAMRNARDATAAAKASGHVLSLCYALAEAGCPVPLATGELKSAEDAISTMVEVATKHRLNFWRLLGHCLRGTLLIRRGMTAKGVEVLRDELNAYRMAGWTMRFPAFLGELAAGLASVGQIPEALASIEEALVRAERDGEMWCASDLTRIKGEIVLRVGGKGHASSRRSRSRDSRARCSGS